MRPNRSCLRFRSVTLLVFFACLVAIASCESEKSQKSANKTDSPPVIISATILPEKPTVESDLTLSIQSQDPKGDPITHQYQWIKNDEEMTGGNQSSLKKGTFKKGDLIRVRVTPSAGKVTGTPFLSPVVKIHNSPPVIQEVWIEPKVAYATDNLKAIVKCSDLEGDFVYYNYQWEINGSVLSDERKEMLEKGRFKKGDSIVVTVTPDDREVIGTPKKSEAILISNSPPQIVSSPPSTVENMAYIYPVKVNEPDKDPVTFTLKSGPPRMAIDKKTGVVKWEMRKEDKGTYPVEIEVSDSEGAKSTQRYNLTIDIK